MKIIKKTGLTPNKKTFFRTGFTLIELLVVISIIGVLAAVVVPNFMGARERSRDIKRKSDIKQIQKAMEMYKDDQIPPSYPENFDAISCKGTFEDAVSGVMYMKEFPCDPADPDSQKYVYDRTDTLEYALYGCLENKSDVDGVAATVDECTSLIKYQVNEP